MHIPDARDTAGYSRNIEDVGGIDICFGGIGINGHIAFNEALDSILTAHLESVKKRSPEK
jgi:glucosamine-6-phosphate deaminase